MRECGESTPACRPRASTLATLTTHRGGESTPAANIVRLVQYTPWGSRIASGQHGGSVVSSSSDSSMVATGRTGPGGLVSCSISRETSERITREASRAIRDVVVATSYVLAAVRCRHVPAPYRLPDSLVEVVGVQRCGLASYALDHGFDGLWDIAHLRAPWKSVMWNRSVRVCRDCWVERGGTRKERAHRCHSPGHSESPHRHRRRTIG